MEPVFLVRAVDLIDGKKERFLCRSQETHHVMVKRGYASFPIQHQDDHIGFLHRRRDLFDDVGGKPLCIRVRETAGIDQSEFPFVVRRIRVVPVPGDTGNAIHQGVPFMGDPVEQRGFSHVGTPDDGDDGLHWAVLSMAEEILDILLFLLRKLDADFSPPFSDFTFMATWRLKS